MTPADTRPAHRGGQVFAMSLVLVALELIATAGCQKSPQISPDNRRLIQTLRTAVAAKRADWLSAASKLVEERRQAGAVSDAEHAALKEVIGPAEQGDWPAAGARLDQLIQAQQPTSEDLERLKPGNRAGPR